MKAKITQALVERAPTVERGRTVLYADPELRGFYLIVSNTKRSYYTQSLVRGRHRDQRQRERHHRADRTIKSNDG